VKIGHERYRFSVLPPRPARLHFVGCDALDVLGGGGGGGGEGDRGGEARHRPLVADVDAARPCVAGRVKWQGGVFDP
jgi:hypothetical protein